MNKLLILSLSLNIFYLTVNASDYPGEPGAGMPGKIEEPSTSTTSTTSPMFIFESSESPSQKTEERYSLDGGLYPSMKAFSPDGTKVMTIKTLDVHNYQIKVWDSLNGSHINTLDIDENVRRVEWNPNSKEIIVGSVTKSTLWKVSY